MTKEKITQLEGVQVSSCPLPERVVRGIGGVAEPTLQWYGSLPRGGLRRTRRNEQGA
jgi:hypothetical protein